MFRALQNRYFLGACAAALLHQILEARHIHLALLDAYLDDLLCMPIVLSVVLQMHRLLRGRQKTYVLPGPHVLLAVVVFALYFEWLAPGWLHSGHADINDISMYAAGGLFYFRHLNIP